MRVFLVSLALSPLVSSGLGAQRLDDAALIQRIDTYVAPLAAHELSGTLLVARGNRILVERSFGFANQELGVRFIPTTPTNVASITKPLTILITSKLAEARRLSVNDTVSKWVPEYTYGSRITVTQLLNHRGGVPHRLLADNEQGEPRTTMDMIRAANALPLLYVPGAQSIYSSGGFAILAAVLERAGGASYDALLQQFVARPVNARTIRHVDTREILPGRASCLMPTADGMLNAPMRDLSFLVGGGSVYTTPHDIFLVMQGIISGTYGPVAKAALLRPTGLEWNGVTSGFRAFADWRADDSLTVMFFANAHTGAIDLLRREIPRMSKGERVAPADVPHISAIALSASARDRVTGAYDTGGGETATLKFVSPSLALFGDRPLLPVNDSTFYSLADYARVTFPTNASGKVEAAQWGHGTWGDGEGPRFARVK